MSYDPGPRRKKHQPKVGGRSEKVGRSVGRGVYRTYRGIRGFASGLRGRDPMARTRRSKPVYRGSRGGRYFKPWRGGKRRYDPYAFADPRRRRRFGGRRRHDPSPLGGRGFLGKLFRGLGVAMAGNVGGVAGSAVANAVPQASVTLPGVGKSINLIGEGGAVALGAFGAKGKWASIVDAFAGGLAAGSDPVAAAAVGTGLGMATMTSRGESDTAAIYL